MTIDELKKSGWIVMEAVSGSQAYGTALPTSDLDIKGIFVLPKNQFYSLKYIPQISDETNDTTYYELGRFFELIAESNPNLLELLSTPEDCLRMRHPLLDELPVEEFLSQQCQQTFAGYAVTQIRKARGLNKKILNPIAKERKGVIDFCYVAVGQGSVPLRRWLEQKGFEAEEMGLCNISHMKNMYALFHARTPGEYRGITASEKANDVALSSIPEEREPDGLMSFNMEGYSTYCKEYKAYWDWVEKRNDVRYSQTLAHGKNYDAKNMMHTFRLLDMAMEIASEKKVNVRRPNRDFLLRIRAGEFEYDELVAQAEKRISKLDDLYQNSGLPKQPDQQRISDLLVRLRRAFYELEPWA